jgi:hypothetical protein
MSEVLVYCPYCQQQAVPAAKRFKTVRNASRQGRSVGHIEEELIVLGSCRNCGKTKEEIQRKFG